MEKLDIGRKETPALQIGNSVKHIDNTGILE